MYNRYGLGRGRAVKLRGDVDTLAKLPNQPFELAVVRVPGTKTTDADMDRLSGLTHVEWLDLCHTEITDAGLARLSKLQSLKSIWLLGTAVSDAGVKELVGLNRLEFFGLNATQITDKSLEYLAHMRSVTSTDLRNTAVTPAALSRLRAARPDCKLMGESVKSDKSSPSSTAPGKRP